MASMRAATSRAVAASRVTTSLPSGLATCTTAPDPAATAVATDAASPGRAWTTMPAMCSSSFIGALAGSAPGRRAHEELVHPDDEAVARDDHARHGGGHHDGKEQEAAQLLR